MRRTVAVVVTLTALALTGCTRGNEPTSAEQTPQPSVGPTGSGTPTSSPEDGPEDGGRPGDAVAIVIVIEGDLVEPNGRRVRVRAGEPITLEITSDRPGELHVHSSPEQVVEVPPGESVTRLTISRPGVVDVEEHESGVIVLRLEVR